LNSREIVATLRALEEQRGAALVARDRAQLDALFTPDLIHIHSTGIQMNKPQLLEYVLNELEFLSVSRSDLTISVHGEVAIMSGRMRNTMRRVDKPEPITADSLVTQVWVNQGGRWRQSHFHACRAA
jgi:hypothetical protein